MKKSILCALLILLSFPSWSADFVKGLIAAQNGDFATAIREWEPLAEQGDADAQFNLALLYDNGWGVPQDYKTAVKWYTLSAKQGNARAQYNLAWMYDNGEGVPQDYKTAVKWYTLAAEQGVAIAQYNLGGMYAGGLGVLQDNLYAHMWWNIAASLGNEDASHNRDFIAEEMTPADISKAQQLARECVAKNYKGC